MKFTQLHKGVAPTAATLPSAAAPTKAVNAIENTVGCEAAALLKKYNERFPEFGMWCELRTTLTSEEVPSDGDNGVQRKATENDSEEDGAPFGGLDTSWRGNGAAVGAHKLCYQVECVVISLSVKCHRHGGAGGCVATAPAAEVDHGRFGGATGGGCVLNLNGITINLRRLAHLIPRSLAGAAAVHGVELLHKTGLRGADFALGVERVLCRAE